MSDGWSGEDRRQESLAIARELGGIHEVLKGLAEDVTEVKRQTTKTNGRVTALEVRTGTEVDRRKDKSAYRLVAISAFATVLGSAIAVVLAHLLS